MQSSPAPQGDNTGRQEALPTRFEIDGVRYYRTGDRPDVCLPSVTAILGKTAGAKAQQALATWNERNPGAKEAAAARGSAIHKACEDHIRGRSVELPDEYLPYWEGLSRHLDQYDGFIWSERPLKPEWSFCVGQDGISRIWSHQYKYCGCPDLVGYRRGSLWMADFKTSVGPYCRYYPRENSRTLFGGWRKFTKCAIQIAAYAIAFEETLGESIENGHILVSTPDLEPQSFILRGDELDRYKIEWRQRVALYYELVAAEKAAAEASGAGLATMGPQQSAPSRNERASTGSPGERPGSRRETQEPRQGHRPLAPGVSGRRRAWAAGAA